MSDQNLNPRGNHQGEFTQGVGGWAEYTVHMTETSDTVRHDVTVPPGKVIPVIFLPGVMGSNLRMSKERQKKLKRDDNRALATTTIPRAMIGSIRRARKPWLQTYAIETSRTISDLFRPYWADPSPSPQRKHRRK